MGSSLDQYIAGNGPKRDTGTTSRTRTDEYIDGASRSAPLTIGLSQAAQPDRAARVLKLRETTALPSDVIERNLDQIEARQRQSSVNVDALQQQAPATASWMADDPKHVELVHDDLTHLTGIERTLKVLGRGFTYGREQSKQGQLEYQALEQGDASLTPEQHRELARLGDDLSREPAGRGFFENLGYQAAKIAGQYVDVVPDVASHSLAGAMTGAAAGALGGPFGVLAGAAGGAAVGGAYGVAHYTFQVEAGNEYAELSQIRGQSGETIAEDEKQNVSMGVGFINGLLETSGVELLASPFKQAAKKLFRQAAADAVVRPTMRAALARIGKSYVGVLAGETAQEVAQEVTSIFGDEIAKMGSDGQFDNLANSPEEREAAVKRLADIAAQTLAGTSVLALPGAAIHGASTVVDAHRAQRREQFFTALGEGVKESKTFQRLPEAMQAIVERATKDGPIENLYAPVAEFTTYFQSKALDPQKVAEQLGIRRDEYDAAIASGSDLVIPTAKYATVIAPTEHNAFFAKELRTRPNEMNAREAGEFADKMKVQAEDAQSTEGGPATSAQKVEDSVVEQLVAAGYDESSARANAKQMAEFFRVQGERSGVDPKALFDRYNVSIKSETPVQPAPLGAKVNLQEVVAHALAHRDQQAERAAISGEPTASPYAASVERDFTKATEAGEFVYARTPAGALRSNLAKVSTDGLIDELAHLLEAQNQDRNQAVPTTVSDENMHTFSDGRDYIGMEGAAVYAAGRFASRAKSVAKIEAEIARRGVADEEVNDRVFKHFTGEDLTDFTFNQSALTTDNPHKITRLRVEKANGIYARWIALATEAANPDNSPSVRAEAHRRARAIEDQAVAEHNAVMRESIKEYEQRTGQAYPTKFAQGERGSIDFQTKDGQAAVSIGLLADADLSTFLHESGHFYLHVMQDLATATDASSVIAADFDAVKQWVGWKDGQAAFTREQHEQFARGFETYLMEGKAPSSALRSTFARFRAWLVGLYRSLGSLQALLSDDVRGVFDRLLATDDEIAAAQREQKMEPLFADPKAVGMSENDAARYRDAIAAARQSAEDDLGRKLIADVQREQSAVYKAERAKVRAEVVAK
jgi:hypothetical protein